MHQPFAQSTPPPPRRCVRAPGIRWVAGIGWALLIPVLVLLGLRLVGVQVGTPWVQLLSLTPLFIIPAVTAAALFTLARRRLHALLAAGAAIVLVVLLVAPFAPRPAGTAPLIGAPSGGSPPTSTQSCRTQAQDEQQQSSQQRNGQGLRMMSLNARLGRADAPAIIETIRRENVQLLVIQEFTPRLGAALAAAGIGELLPHTHQSPEGGAAGAGTYSTMPLTAREVPGIEAMSFLNTTVAFALTDAGGRARTVEVTNVHTFPPLPDAVDSWRHDVAALAHINAAGGTRILAGDFNATYDHREFRDLLHSNPAALLSDASTGALARLQPTWPREHAFSPGIVIDHVLTSADVSTCGYGTQRIPGSDHAAVLVTLNLD